MVCIIRLYYDCEWLQRLYIHILQGCFTDIVAIIAVWRMVVMSASHLDVSVKGKYEITNSVDAHIA